MLCAPVIAGYVPTVACPAGIPGCPRYRRANFTFAWVVSSVCHTKIALEIVTTTRLRGFPAIAHAVCQRTHACLASMAADGGAHACMPSFEKSVPIRNSVPQIASASTNLFRVLQPARGLIRARLQVCARWHPAAFLACDTSTR